MRRTKFIIYQCAMIFLVVSESIGTAVLSDYLKQRKDLAKQFPGIHVFNNDYIGIASYNIFVGVFSAIVFGAAFFFDLFFPNRYEPTWVQNMWMGGAVFSSVAGLGDALAYTIILALHSEVISNYDMHDPALLAALAQHQNKTPISYKHSGRAIASVVFLWAGWVCSVASTVVMITFYRHCRKYGSAKSTHARRVKRTRLLSNAESPIREKRPVPDPLTHPESPNDERSTQPYTIAN